MKIPTLILACVALAGCHAKKLSYRDPFYFGGKDTAKTYIPSPFKGAGTSATPIHVDTNLKYNQYAWAGRVPGQDQLDYYRIVNPSRSNYLFRKNNVTIIKISPPDSDKVITVTFSKSLVNFINDSTFTYKQK